MLHLKEELEGVSYCFSTQTWKLNNVSCPSRELLILIVAYVGALPRLAVPYFVVYPPSKVASKGKLGTNQVPR